MKDTTSLDRNMISLARSFRFAASSAAALFLTAVSSAQVTPCDSNNFCSSVPNELGVPALMSSNGQCVVADNNFVISASPVPNKPGLFFYGQGQAGMGGGVPFGRGLRCVGGNGFSVFRLGVSHAMGNTLSRALNFDNLTGNGAILAGSTWNFQAWFRDQDPAGLINYNLSDGLQVTFVDPLPDVEFSLPSRSVSEGAGMALVKVELSAPSFVDVEVPFTTSGDAINPDDYTVVASPLVIPAGQLSVDIVVTIVEDMLYETDESVIFQLGAPTNALLGALQMTELKIQEDDPVPVVAFDMVSSSAPESAASITISVGLSAVSVLDVTVPFTLAGTALDPADYSISASPVMIPAGQTSVDITVNPVDESLVELDETVVVNLGVPANAALGAPAQHTLTLTDNDVALVDFDVPTQNLGEASGATILRVLMLNPSSQDVTVMYSIAGSASSPADYSIAASPLVIPAGAMFGDISLVPVDDMLVEGNETIIVTLTGAINAGLGIVQQHVVTLFDNDSAVVDFAITMQSMGEGASPRRATVNLSNPSTTDVTVMYTVGGSASDPDDYAASVSPLIILAGDTSADITIVPVDDMLVEGNETIVLTLSGVSGAGLGSSLVHTATILDNDAATVDFALALQDLGEGAAAVGLTVNLSNVSIQDVTVMYTVGGTASDPGDFGIAASPLIIPAGSMSADILLTPADDALVEGNETVIVTLAGATNASLGATLVHTATLIDDDVALVDFAITMQDLVEGASPRRATVNLSNLSTQDVTVMYSVGGSASDPDDYTITASPITIFAGDMSADITLVPSGDMLVEGDETVILTLTGATNGSLGSSLVHTATLLDDDVATVDFALAMQNLGEGAGATGLMVNLSNPSTQDVTVMYTVGGTATSPDDYSIAASPLTILAGNTSASILLAPAADMLVEGNETVIVTLTGATNGSLGTSLIHTATLVDDDVATVEFALAMQDVGEGAAALGLNVNLSNVSTEDVTVMYSVAGTASDPDDYAIAATPLTILAGNMSADILLTPADDMLVEGDETVIVTLTGATNASVGIVNIHTATLLDDDFATVEFDLAMQSLAEGAAPLGLTVNLSNVSTQDVTVMYTVGGTATDPDDYGIAASPLTILAGNLSADILLTPSGDMLVEGDETVIVTLSGATGASLGAATIHTATLLDDDVATVNFALAMQSLAEGAAATGLTVNLSNVSTQDVTVMYMVGGTATDPDDFGIAASPLTILAGDLSADILLTPAGDMLVEGDETVIVTLTGATGASLGATLVHTATLLDDDVATVEFALAMQNVGEGAAATGLTVNLSNVSAQDVTVMYMVGGTATDPDDYGIAASPLTILAGNMSADITLTPADDMLVEGDETVIVTLTGATGAGLGAATVHTVTLIDDEVATVEFDLAMQNVGEGAAALGLTVNLSNVSMDDVTVMYTVGGTASDPADYGIAASPLTILAGNLSADITLTPADDMLVEGDETVIVTLTGATNAGVGVVNEHTLTLTDDDVLTAQFSLQNQDIAEGPSEGSPVLTVTLSNPAAEDVMVTYTVGGTATGTDDYTIDASPVTVLAGETSAVINLLPVDDQLVEQDETIVITLTASSTGTIGGSNVHTATLVDNDVATVDFDIALQDLGEGAMPIGLTVNLSNASTQNVTVMYTVGGTATDPDDFGIAASPLMIMAGDMSADILLTPVDDMLLEGDETVIVTLTGANNGSLGTALVHTATLLDDDVPTVDFDLVMQNLGEGAPLTGITVNLSDVLAQDVTVTYTVAGTATDPDDYGIAASPLVILAGNLSADIDLTPADDMLIEGDETVIITLTGATNASLGASSVHATTLVDDDLLTVDMAQAMQNVGEGTASASITVNLSAMSATDVTVMYTVGGTATDPDDYTLAASPLTITAGQLSADILLMPVDDMLVESGETVIVTLSGASGAALGSSLVHAATLVDNDGTPLASDDFNQCTLAGIWTLTDPQGDVTVSTRGAGTDDAQLVMSIPAGTHLPFDTIAAPRLTQVVSDSDFEIEVKFDSLLSGTVQDQGVLILEDELNWLRFDFFSTGTTLNLFAASTVAGVSAGVHNEALGTAVSPTWMRINRAGDQWTLSWSLDGTIFTQATSFAFAMNVSEAGVYVGNSGPAHTMVVDYVFDTSAPISPEDGAVMGEVGRMLTINSTGSGSVTKDPDAALYYCSSEVALTAVPDSGWVFDHWETDLTGSTNPDTVTMSMDRTVTAVFVMTPLSVDLAIASQGVSEAAGATAITVNLSGVSAMDVSVMYSVAGTATDPADYTIAASPLVITAGQLSADIVLTPFDDMDLEPGETVIVTLTGATNAALGSLLVHTATLIDNDGTPLASDDFNQCSLAGIWSLTDPQGDVTVSMQGAGTDDAQLMMSIPSGIHDPFNTITAPRLTQAVSDSDFEIEVKFDSLVTGTTQDQGVLILEDELNWLRFDFFSSGANMNLFAATTVAGTSATVHNSGLGASTSPTWMRINRTGDQWTLFWSLDGVVFTQAASFSHALNVSEAGVYVGNSGPAHTMLVDYVFETSTPVVPEDGAVMGEVGRMLTVSTTGSGSVTQDPDVPLYYCSSDVTLTAVPSMGWMFDHWEMDLTGSTNPETLTMSVDRAVTAVFIQAPLTVDVAMASQNVPEGAGATNITVSLSAISAMDVDVTYSVMGTATDPDDYTIAASPLTIMAGQLSANIVLMPVDDMLVESSETVVVTLTGATNAGLGSSLVHTASLIDDDGIPLVSDDFNQCALAGIWTLTDPQGDVTVSTRGPGSDDAQLVMSIPAGSHDPFNTISAPRLTQVVPDNDFEIEVKFDSLVTGTTQDQGVLILEDELNWLRFDFFSSGTNLNLFAASTVAGASSIEFNAGLGLSTSPTWMRINRTADQWTLFWSLDGIMFTQAASFSFAMNVSEAGVYVGNAGPAHTMVVDYVFETGSPVVPEDGAVSGEVGQLLTVNITGNGSVSQDPDAPLYYCSDDVTLNAVPDAGWAFDHWEMDLTGSVNPEMVTMSADRTVTAVFVLDAVGPVISNVVVTPSSVSAMVTWTTDEPSTTVVDFGEGNLAQQVSDGTLVISHSIMLTGLTAGTMYQYQVTSADSLMQATSGMVDNFTTTSLAGFESDDFNHPNLDLTRWSLVDPLADGELNLVGSGTADARLVLVAPAGGTEHAPWIINDSVRVMQPSSDGDMQVEVKFESDIDTVGQVIGIAIEEAPDTWIRFDFHFDGVGVSAFAAGITSSVVQVSSSGGVSATPIAANTPVFMRVTRVGDMWTQEFSFDRAVWTVATSFAHALTVNNVGVFAGNEGGTPPRTEAVVDYFLNTNLAPTPEDSGVPVDSTQPYNYTLTGSILSENSVQLQWATDEPSSATVNYGLTPAFELGAFDTYPVASSRSAVISGLMADTPYYFEVVTTDGMSNQGAAVGPMLRTYPAGYMGFPLVDVWYGQINGMGELAQPFGHLGVAQTWVNVVGKVRDLDGALVSLTYELNGSGQLPLSMGLNRFPWRLSQDGDFNVEIATADLSVGKNEVVLRAIDNEGKLTAMLVRVDYTSGVVWASTYSIDWSTVTDVQDVAQVVDGKWRIEDDPAFMGEKVIRTDELGYDRILTLGDIQWENYEVNFQMTANALDPDGFTASSNSFAIGCILRWEGHVATDAQQPRVGFDPIGGLFAYRWFPGSERWDHYGTNFQPNIGRTSSPVMLGVTYLVKGQVETMPDDTRVYRLKSWERGTAEPGTWLYEVTHGAGTGLDTGSFLLFSNHVDASFGNISVVPLP